MPPCSYLCAPVPLRSTPSPTNDARGCPVPDRRYSVSPSGCASLRQIHPWNRVHTGGCRPAGGAFPPGQDPGSPNSFWMAAAKSLSCCVKRGAPQISSWRCIASIKVRFKKRFRRAGQFLGFHGVVSVAWAAPSAAKITRRSASSMVFLDAARI